MQAEFGGEVPDWTRAKNAGVTGGPSAVGLQVFALAAESVVDAAVQHHFAGAPLNAGKRNFTQERNWIVIELVPADRIEIAENTDGIVVPAPADVTSQSPEALLGGSDKAVKSAGLADHGGYLTSCSGQRLHFIFGEAAGFDCLHD